MTDKISPVFYEKSFLWGHCPVMQQILKQPKYENQGEGTTDSILPLDYPSINVTIENTISRSTI